MNLLLRQGLRYHRRHLLQTLLTLLGIAAGVGLLVAMQLSQRTAERAFDRGIETVAGTATHAITAAPLGLSSAQFAAALAYCRGRGIAPSLQAIARRDGDERTVLRVLGIDPLLDRELRPWGAGDPGEALPLAPLLTTPGGFVATADLLQRLGLEVGASLQLSIQGRSHRATCVGVLQVPPRLQPGLVDLLLVDIATAQLWTERRDRIDRLELRHSAQQRAVGVDEAAFLRGLQELLGPAVAIEATGARQGALAQLARGFRINLRALSLLSLLVGAFLVHETMRLSVLARRGSFGVLRALGLRSAALGRLVACEALILGLLGSLGGALLGSLLAERLLQPLVRTLNDHYATFDLPALELDPWVLVAAVALGGLVAVLAGLGPAFHAMRVSPREVLVAAQRAAAPAVKPFAIGACCFAALATLLLTTSADRLLQAYCGVLALLAAVVLLVPLVFSAGLRLLVQASGSGGAFWRYLLRSTASARSHLGLPLAAMVLALATTIGLSTLVSSFRQSVAEWLHQVLPADVYVAVPTGTTERTVATLDPQLVELLRKAPGAAAFSTYRRCRVQLAAGGLASEVELVGLEPSPDILAAFLRLGNADAAAGQALLRGEAAFVSEPLAFRHGLQVGSELRIQTPQGPVSLPVMAIYRDYSNERGELLVGAEFCNRHLPVAVTAVALEAASGRDIEAWANELRQLLATAADQAVQVRTQGELRRTSLEIFDRTFAITSAMRLLCLLVAFFGIYAAFASLQLERGREIGVLRCLGARPRRIAGLVLGQTALLGAAAGVLALPVGALLGQVLARIINRISFGWSLSAVEVPAAAMFEVLWLAIAAALLAGVQPALRFARMRPVEALRES